MVDNLDVVGFDDIETSRPIIPDGEYSLRVVEPKLNEKNDKSGHYITYSAIVQAGPHAGYRVFNGLFSLGRENVWQLKRDTKAAGFEFPAGLSLLEAARYFVDNANGFEFVGLVASRVRQAKDANGNYVPDPDGSRENTIKRWVAEA